MNNLHTSSIFNLYKTRSFSEKFNVCTEWLSQNWKAFFKHFSLLILPFCIIQGYFLKSVMQIANGAGNGANYVPTASDIANIVLCYLITIVSSILASSFFFALIKRTFIQHEGLQDLSFKDIWHTMKGLIGRYIIILIAACVIISVCAIVLILPSVASTYTLFVTLPLLIAISIALFPVLPIYLLTDEPIMQAISHAFRLGFKCWWGFFSTMLVMAIFMGIIQVIGCIPTYAVSAIHIIMKMSGTGSSIFVELLNYLANVFMYFVSSATSLLMALITCVQYGHAVMKIDKEEPLNIEDRIKQE